MTARHQLASQLRSRSLSSRASETHEVALRARKRTEEVSVRGSQSPRKVRVECESGPSHGHALASSGRTGQLPGDGHESRERVGARPARRVVASQCELQVACCVSAPGAAVDHGVKRARPPVQHDVERLPRRERCCCSRLRWSVRPYAAPLFYPPLGLRRSRATPRP